MHPKTDVTGFMTIRDNLWQLQLQAGTERLTSANTNRRQMVVSWIASYLLRWLNFISWTKQLFGKTFAFCIILMKCRKLTLVCRGNSLWFYLVVENCFFLANFILGGEGNFLSFRFCSKCEKAMNLTPISLVWQKFK